MAGHSNSFNKVNGNSNHIGDIINEIGISKEKSLFQNMNKFNLDKVLSIIEEEIYKNEKNTLLFFLKMYGGVDEFLFESYIAKRICFKIQKNSKICGYKLGFQEPVYINLNIVDDDIYNLNKNPIFTKLREKHKITLKNIIPIDKNIIYFITYKITIKNEIIRKIFKNFIDEINNIKNNIHKKNKVFIFFVNLSIENNFNQKSKLYKTLIVNDTIEEEEIKEFLKYIFDTENEKNIKNSLNKIKEKYLIYKNISQNENYCINSFVRLLKIME